MAIMSLPARAMALVCLLSVEQACSAGVSPSLSASTLDETDAKALSDDEACFNDDEEDCSVSMRQLRLQSKKDGQLGFDADGCFESNSYWLELSGTPTMEGTSKSIAATAAECQRHCSLAPGCGHFSFWHDGGCLLTSDSASSRQHGGVVSGPATCGAHGAAVAKPVFKEGEKNVSARAGLEPPEKATTYNGVAWETMKIPGKKEMHIFAIGDWGGMDGTLNPIENREELLVFNGGKKAGPSVFPRTRWDKHHNSEICDHKQFIECFDQKGYPPCVPGCGYVRGVDDQPQILVANAFKARASLMKPDYILNVGDNFYWGGIEKNCGTPMGQLSYTALHQFNQIFEGVYTGQALSKVPWLSVLGNHDYGGRVFNNGWDQQIAYTWYSKRWVMPSPYWSQHVEYPDLNFTVDIYMLDSNAMDAKDPEEDPEHNLCGAKHNPGNADCTAAEGPSSVASCKAWFWDLWAEQQIWIEEQLDKSEADWQIAVTHFPCGHQKEFYKKLHQIDYGFPNVSRGLDLLVTGHRHDQELWDPAKVEIGDDLHDLGGLTCFVTGGGGGITSEATPNPYDKKDWYGQAQYGFYDLTITKNLIVIKSLNYDGKEVASAKVWHTTTTSTTTTTTATTTTRTRTTTTATATTRTRTMTTITRTMTTITTTKTTFTITSSTTAAMSVETTPMSATVIDPATPASAPAPSPAGRPWWCFWCKN